MTSNIENIMFKEKYNKEAQTFSSGYTVFLQAAHLSWVPENKAENLFGAFPCKQINSRT